MKVRLAGERDRAAWLRLRRALWPERDAAWHESEVDDILGHRFQRAAYLGLDEDGSAAGSAGIVGFVEVSRRPRVDGCETSPVGYLDALYVDPAHRRRGLGRGLAEAAQAWAASHGCREMAAGAGIDDEAGRAVHARLGFGEVCRLVVLRKSLAAAPNAAAGERGSAASGVTGLEWSTAARPALPSAIPSTGAFPVAAGANGGRGLRLACHLAVWIGGVAALLNTRVWTDDVFYGGVLPLVDLAFVIYLLVMTALLLYRRRTARSDWDLDRLLAGQETAPEATPEHGEDGPGPG